MKSSRIRNVYLILTNCIFSISASALSRKYQGKSEKECTKTIIETISKEDSGNIGDFHNKTDTEKIEALWAEFRIMLRNGNNYTKHLEQGVMHHIETKRGQPYLDEMFEEFMQNVTSNTVEYNLTSCKIATMFVFALKMMKHSISKKRIGPSDTFFPMVRDIITSIDPEKQLFIDSPAAIYACGNLAFAAAPDFVLSILTVMTYIPDEILDQFSREFPKALKSMRL